MKGFFTKLCKKNALIHRILSVAMSVLMLTSVLQMLPAGILKSYAAENYSVKLHCYNASGWADMSAWIWDDDNNYSGGNWPGVNVMTNGTEVSGKTGWYDYSITGVKSSKLGVILSGGGTQTGNMFVDLSYIPGETKELWVTSAGSILATAPASYNGGNQTIDTSTVTLHCYNASKWSNFYAYCWDASDNKLAGVWPGSAVTNSVTGKDDWYDITLSNVTNSELNIILNNDSDSQTQNMQVDLSTVSGTDKEIWVIASETNHSGNVYTTAPTIWTSGSGGSTVEAFEGDVTFHYKNQDSWEKVYLYTWNSNNEWQTGGWPGTMMLENSANSGWYDTKATLNIFDSKLNFKFSNNDKDNPIETNNLNAVLTEGITDIWVTGGSSVSFTTTKPDGWNDGGESSLKSPVVNGREVTFNYVDDSVTEAYIRGSLCGWYELDQIAMTKEDGVWTHTMTLSPGKYTYKFYTTTWVNDPLNPNKSGDDNVLIVSGLCDYKVETTKGTDVTLPDTINYMDENGEETAKAVTYSVKAEDAAYVTLTDKVVNVAETCQKKEIRLDATAEGGLSSEVILKLVDATYVYTIYAHSAIADRNNLNNTSIYIWDKAEETELENQEYAFTKTEVLDDDRVWMKYEIELSASKELGFILKNKGDWSWQSDDLIFKNTAKKDQTLYIVDGYSRIYTDLNDVPMDKYLYVEYERNDASYDNTYAYAWNNGYTYKDNGQTRNLNYQVVSMNGKYVAKIPVVAGTVDKDVSFIMQKGTDLSSKDGDDNKVTVSKNSNITKVRFKNGKVDSVVPDTTGYTVDRENKTIQFFYRDEKLFAECKLDSLKDVKLVLRTATGTDKALEEATYTMTYSYENDRFESEKLTLTADTDYYYYYMADSSKKLDSYNTKQKELDNVTYSLYRNKVYDVTLSASVKYSSMDYDDNNIVTLAYSGTDIEGFTPEKIYVDLSALGLDSKTEMDPELMALSFGCLEGTSIGGKAIGITLVDDCDTEYKTNVTVNVKARTKTANTDEKLGTFDWDEAVIYFAVTDRFFDGNTANNTGSEYNTSDAGSYHGGDFAGLTQKIDYLYDLGVNTIWLTPIVENIDMDMDTKNEYDDCDYYAYHGYWASDFTKLNSHLGTEEEFEALITAAHNKGMKIMVDVVLNHPGYETEDYFNSIIDGKDMVRDDSNTVQGDNILSSLSGLPDFVTEDEDVRNQLIEWQTSWMTKYDIDYYRVDTVKHVDNTTWSAFKNALIEKNQDFKLIGEYYDAGYVNDYDQLDSGRMDSVLDFDFKNIMLKLVEEDLAGIEEALSDRNASLTNTATLGSFTSSHDEAGLLYKMEQSKGEWAESLMRVAATYQITAKGQPVIYYGEEIGLSGDSNYPYYDNRYDFDWDEQSTQASNSSSMYNHYKTLLNIRRDYSEVFAKGTRTQVVSPLIEDASGNSINQGYEVFSRSYEGKTVYVGTNVWGDAKTTKVYVSGEVGSTYQDLYNNQSYTVDSDGSITITIPSANNGGTAILVGTEKTVEDTNEITLKLHYSRTKGDYDNWTAWVWTDGAGGSAYEFEEENGEMVATVTVDARTTTKIYYIMRLGDWKDKDHNGNNQYIDVSDMLSGTVHFYVEQSVFGGTRILGSDAVTGNKIVSTSYDRNSNKVTVNMASEIAGNIKEAFTIKCTSNDKQIGIKDVEENGNVYTLTLSEDISSLTEMLKSYTITFDGFTYNLTTPNVYSSEEFENAYTYYGDDLGLTYTSTKSTFKLWAPTADTVTLNVYESGTKGTNDLLNSYAMTKGEKGVWSYELSGDWNGKYYTYTVHVDNKDNELCDPYARTTGVNGNRAMILDLDSTDPEGWDKDTGAHEDMNYTDAVIYELHVRDLSSDSSSGVSKEHQGKFLGLTETGTTTTGGMATALDHLIELGVTHLHLLPIYDYASVDESDTTTAQFNWGYDPLNYNVPEGSYSTDAYNGEVRVKEMKQMVQTLHNNNINVVMDVVYNHVYDAGTFCFNQAVPKYFSRTNADGSYSNGSGCGNDTASERSMVHKYIVDSILYWHEEYHIDGFRFDLVGLLDTDTINEIVDSVHAIDPDILFYGEGWTMSTTVSKDNVTMATQANAASTPDFAFFSDTFRDGVAGNNTNGQGLIWGNGSMDTMSACYLARPWWCNNPTQTINYASCHDNYTLMDKINEVSGAKVTSYDTVPGEYQVKLNNLTAAYYMFAEGIPLIHAGEDFLRIKLDENGEVIHNSYNSSDYVNKLRWYNLDTEIYADTTNYYKGLIAFRKNHASLRLSTKAEVDKNVSYYQVSNNVMLYKFKGNESVSDEVADEIVTIYNVSSDDCQINLYSSKYGITQGNWQICVNGEKAGTDVLEIVTNGIVNVPAHTAMALVLGETVDENSVYTANNKVTVSIEDTENQVDVDSKITLNANVNPVGSTLKWKSSDVSVATVDEDGNVEGVSEGTVTITVSTLHGVSDSIEITVTSPTPPVLTLEKTEYTVEAGKTEVLVLPESEEKYTWTFKSSDDTVAKVETGENPTIVTYKEGSVTITVTRSDGASADITVTVTKKSENPTPPVLTLEKTEYTVEVSDYIQVKLPGDENSELKWTFESEDSTIAEVKKANEGFYWAFGYKEGTTTVTITREDGASATITVTVTKKTTLPSITIDKTELTLKVGESETVTATYTNMYVGTTSSDETVATVKNGENGERIITAVGEGTAIITFQTTTDSVTCKVTVVKAETKPTPPTPPVLTLEKTEYTVEAGKTEVLVLPESEENYTWTFKSSDDTVAKVETGENPTIVTYKEGNVTITVTRSDGASADITVTVTKKSENPTPTPPTPPVLTLTKTEYTIEVSEFERVELPDDENSQLTWTFESEDSTIAEVKKGTEGYYWVYGYEEGTTTVTITREDGASATITVTVTKKSTPSTPVIPTPPTPVTPIQPVTPSTPDVPSVEETIANGNSGITTSQNNNNTTNSTEIIVVSEEENIPESVETVTNIITEVLKKALKTAVEKLLLDITNDVLEDGSVDESTIKEIQKAITAGDNILVEVLLEVLDETDVDAKIQAAFQKALEEFASGKEGTDVQIAQYLDLSVLLTNAKGTEYGKLYKLDKPITLTIAVPDDLKQDGRIFVVLRIHDGETTVLETTWNEDGTLSFETDRFSTYALAYIDSADTIEDGTDSDAAAPIENPSDEIQDTNDYTTFIIVGIVIVVIAAIFIMLLALKSKKKEK